MAEKGLGQVWNPSTMMFENGSLNLNYDPEFSKSFGVTEDMWNSYPAAVKTEIINGAANLGYSPNISLNNGGLSNWFSSNKDLIAGGIGLGQLGLGALNYTQNKKALKSDLASAEQARRLNEEAAQNKRNIQNKAQQSLRFS